MSMIDDYNKSVVRRVAAENANVNIFVAYHDSRQ